MLLSAQPPTPPCWKFYSPLLSDANFCNTISVPIDDFLIFNKTSSTSHSLPWESLKAYLKGQIISCSSYLNNTLKTKLDELSEAILELGHQYALTPSPALYIRSNSTCNLISICCLLGMQSLYFCAHGAHSCVLWTRRQGKSAAGAPIKTLWSINQAVTTIIWEGVVPRVSISLLQRCRLSGGFTLPN